MHPYEENRYYEVELILCGLILNNVILFVYRIMLGKIITVGL